MVYFEVNCLPFPEQWKLNDSAAIDDWLMQNYRRLIGRIIGDWLEELIVGCCQMMRIAAFYSFRLLTKEMK